MKIIVTNEINNGEVVYLKGNYLTGVKLTINSETFPLMSALKWYDILLSLLPFSFNSNLGEFT